MLAKEYPASLTFVLASLLLTCGAAPPHPSESLRGALIRPDRVDREQLEFWRSQRANCLVLPLEEATLGSWGNASKLAAGSGLKAYAWIEVGRSPELADAHPEWMASPGEHHSDWRRRFPGLAEPKPGELVKLWPWVPIGYEAVFQGHLKRIEALLDRLPKDDWSGVFLNDLQTSPSSCGCGNDQCRWALDYGGQSTTPKRPGTDAATALMVLLRAR